MCQLTCDKFFCAAL